MPWKQMSTRLNARQDFRNVIDAIKAQPIQLSKYGRKHVKVKGHDMIIHEDLKFTRRTRYWNDMDTSATVQVALLEYVKSGKKEYFVQFQYFTNGNPKTREYTTSIKRSRINYYLKKNNFVAL